jgi:hypothetical protein
VENTPLFIHNFYQRNNNYQLAFKMSDIQLFKNKISLDENRKDLIFQVEGSLSNEGGFSLTFVNQQQQVKFVCKYNNVEDVLETLNKNETQNYNNKTIVNNLQVVYNLTKKTLTGEGNSPRYSLGFFFFEPNEQGFSYMENLDDVEDAQQLKEEGKISSGYKNNPNSVLFLKIVRSDDDSGQINSFYLALEQNKVRSDDFSFSAILSIEDRLSRRIDHLEGSYSKSIELEEKVFHLESELKRSHLKSTELGEKVLTLESRLEELEKGVSGTKNVTSRSFAPRGFTPSQSGIYQRAKETFDRQKKERTTQK